MIGNTLDLENKKEKGNTNPTFLPSLEDEVDYSAI